MKIAPWSPKRERTLWLDADTGAAVDDDGRRLPVTDGTPSLADVLTLAERAHVVKVMLTGGTVAREWLLQLVPGWTHGRHFLDHDVPTGRYRHDIAGVTVEVRRCAEWFGEGTYTPADARAAWEALETALYRSGRGGSALMRSPGATGLDLWLRSARAEVPDPLDDDTQHLIRTTSPQHRIEIRPAMRDELPALWVLDGRWFYAALTRGLGSGPARHLNGADAADLFGRDQYARARYLVRFAAPDWWTETPGALGLLMARAGDDVTDGWHAPMTGTTWADAAEVHLAARCGWSIDFLEGIAFTPGLPLDTWTTRLVRARERVTDDELGPIVADMVRTGVRAVLLHAIGSWHSAGRDETTVTDSPMQPPPGDGWDAPERLAGGGALWRRRAGLPSPRALAMRHPEWSSQVWGRAHARVMDCPTGTGANAGALAAPWPDVVALYGDAVMLARRPAWADLDDGRPGRLRVKGHVCGPIPWPRTASERDVLTRTATAAGTVCERGCA